MNKLEIVIGGGEVLGVFCSRIGNLATVKQQEGLVLMADAIQNLLPDKHNHTKENPIRWHSDAAPPSGSMHMSTYVYSCMVLLTFSRIL